MQLPQHFHNNFKKKNYVYVWIQRLRLRISIFFFFFFMLFTVSGDIEHCSRDLQPLYSEKKKLKMGPTILFTHLENILLQCFQFLVFSFQQNKLYPNEPYMCQAVTSFNLCSLLTSLFLPNSDNL